MTSDGPHKLVRHKTACVSVASARAVGYRRVSTSEQAASGLGLDAQQTAIDHAAARLGLLVLQTFTDAGVSGGLALDERPGLIAALDQLRSGDTLVIAKRDRLGRDVLNVAMIERLVERKGARIVSPDAPDTNDPSSRLMRQIIDAFSEYERALIRARTRAAMAAAKARGQRVGWIPYGSRLDCDGRSLVPHDHEQETLRLLRQLRTAGRTQQEIAHELNRRGLMTRDGAPFQRSFVAQLLQRHPAEIV